MTFIEKPSRRPASHTLKALARSTSLPLPLPHPHALHEMFAIFGAIWNGYLKLFRTPHGISWSAALPLCRSCFWLLCLTKVPRLRGIPSPFADRLLRFPLVSMPSPVKNSGLAYIFSHVCSFFIDCVFNCSTILSTVNCFRPHQPAPLADLRISLRRVCLF